MEKFATDLIKILATNDNANALVLACGSGTMTHVAKKLKLLLAPSYLSGLHLAEKLSN